MMYRTMKMYKAATECAIVRIKPFCFPVNLNLTDVWTRSALNVYDWTMLYINRLSPQNEQAVLCMRMRNGARNDPVKVPVDSPDVLPVEFPW